jgi:hypothetical protein
MRMLHSKKKVREFPVPSWDVTTKLSLGGNNDVITELFLPRESLVSDNPAGDGKLGNLFYGVDLNSAPRTQYLHFFALLSEPPTYLLLRILFIFGAFWCNGALAH